MVSFKTSSNWKGWDVFPDEIFVDLKEKETVESLQRTYATLLPTGSVRLKEPDDAFFTLALDRIRRDPVATVATWFKRMPRLWYQLYIPMYRDLEPSGWFFVGYFVFGLYAFVSGTRHDKVLMTPIVLVFAYLTVFYFPLHVEPRYGVPCMPALISACGIGLWKLGSRALATLDSRPLPARG